MKDTEIVEQIEKKKRKRPDLAERNSVHVDGKELKSQIEFSMTLFNLPSIDTNDAGAVQARLTEYFGLCVQYEVKPSFAGMASALGVDRMTLWRWCNEQGGGKPREVRDTIKKARDMLNQMLENWMQNGQVNPVVGIFLGKNNFGYADKSEVVLTPNNPLGDQKDRSEIEARYRDSIAAPDGEPTFVELPAETPEVEGVFSEGEGNDTI